MPIINGKTVDLAEYSKQFRNEELTKNKYSRNNEYNLGNKDALSDGDVLGKGEQNGSIGSSDDIKKRIELQSKNIYTINSPYDSSKVS